MRSSRSPVVLIDGPSGAGKSTFADGLVAAWPGGAPNIVRMDDVYPGWEGLLRASSHVYEYLLAPLRSSGSGSWQRWDWTSSRPAGWNRVVGGHPLIIEGCGCLTRQSAPLADLRVWLTASDEVRKVRALARDGGTFDAHWDGWQRQWERFIAQETPEELADIIVDTTA